MRWRKSLGLIAIATLVASGCSADEGDYRVGMKRVSSDFTYGVPELSEVAAPPGAIPAMPPQSALPAATSEPEPDEEPEFISSFRPVSRPAPPAVQRCPEAGPNDFPAEPAPNVISTKPKEGLYVWKMKGTQKVPPLPFPFVLPQFVDRSVEAVTDDAIDPRGTFTFETRERDPSIGSNTVITQTFKVDQSNPGAQLRGVFLARIERDDQDGSPPRAFQPTTPVLYLPLPVRVGAAFESTGIDPTNPLSLQTLAHRGVVKERRRVDACGEVVDSWFVEAEQIIGAGTSSTRRRFDYSIATQFGGLIVAEHVESPCGSTVDGACTPEPDLVYDANIGQVEPDPPRPR